MGWEWRHGRPPAHKPDDGPDHVEGPHAHETPAFGIAGQPWFEKQKEPATSVKDKTVDQPALRLILEDEAEVIKPGLLKAVDGAGHGIRNHVNVGIGEEEDIAFGQDRSAGHDVYRASPLATQKCRG